MKVAVRYHSRTGNTKKIAEAIAEELGVPAEDLSAPLPEKVEILFLGSAVYAAGIDDAVKKFIKDNKDNIGTLYNFSTAAALSSTYKQIKKQADECGVKLAEEEFHCRGKFLFFHSGRPNSEDCDRARAFAKEILKNTEENHG